MSSQDPDADRTFTLEDLVGGEKAFLSSMNGSEKAGELTGTVDEADYSTRLQEILGVKDEDEHREAGEHGHSESGTGDDDGEDEEGFIYDGADAVPRPTSYDAQLAELLDGVDSESGAKGALEVSDATRLLDTISDEPLDYDKYKDEAPSVSPASNSPTPSQLASSNLLTVPGQSQSPTVRPPFLHPSVSRLRSSLAPPRARVLSSFTLRSNFGHIVSPEPSHFSAISRASSISGANEPMKQGQSISKTPLIHHPKSDYVLASPLHTTEHEVFRWTSLKHISAQVYSLNSKAAVLLNAGLGRPTVIVAGGLICVGTHTGRTAVFDFRQEFKFICGVDVPSEAGAVSALALSFDHTFLAVGHVAGHIFLYDLSRPQAPARTVIPVDYESVLAARKEGHLFGSRINQLDFVGSRHTAIVSADEAGLAFYHSLGKVLFVEANDVLRILGNYPEDHPSTAQESTSQRLPNPSVSKRHRRSAPILAMSSLPPASSHHPIDAFNVIALLTPIKIVIVGLKPAPRTWYRRHRGGQDGDGAHSAWRGSMAWFPSMSNSSVTQPSSDASFPLATNGNTKISASQKSKGEFRMPAKYDNAKVTKPILAYSWGRTVLLLRARVNKVTAHFAEVREDMKGKTAPVHTLGFEEIGELLAESDVLSLHWLNQDQLLVVTLSSLEIYDTQTLRLIDTTPSHPTDFGSCLSHQNVIPKPPSDIDPGYSLGVSLDIYKGKVFVLGSRSMQVGTLLSWADRILALVEMGDFLGAIDLTRIYYLGEAKGNMAGLPSNPTAMRILVGQKLRALMSSSAQYVFSDDRLTDEMHRTLDGRGVDRTALFEDLVLTTFRASVALDDFDFLFDDLFDYYEESGIVGIYLQQIQSLVLSGDLHTVPPRVSQKLVAFHDERGSFDTAERLIWHLDPSSLDISQVIHLCQTHDLYDALIYVYTSALKDYVSPLVELLGLIRKVRRTRLERPSRVGRSLNGAVLSVERLVPNAYKVYAYLSDILSGLTHPSHEPIPTEEAFKAKAEVYSFLFRGSSSLWQGQLILTADEENGPEPTYPYLRLLVRFDAEAMLHSLDQAFEDSYLNDSDGIISRQDIIDALLEILRSRDLSSSDLTFLRIFIARNVPKYPQFIRLPSSILRSVLVGLASDKDQSTREDRQLAVEILLSSYSLKDDNILLHLFEEAEFFRILRHVHRLDKRWGSLTKMYLQDNELTKEDLFGGIQEVLSLARRSRRSDLAEVESTISDALPLLLEASLSDTALLLDGNMPNLHDEAVAHLRTYSPSKELYYLRRLIQPTLGTEIDGDDTLSSLASPSHHLSSAARVRFIELHCMSEPSLVLPALSSLPTEYFNLSDVVDVCEETEVFDALAWALNAQGLVTVALDRADRIMEKQAILLAENLMSSIGKSHTIDSIVDRLGGMAKTLIQISTNHSHSCDLPLELPADELWFRLLRSEVSLVQTVSSALNSVPDNAPLLAPAASAKTVGRLRFIIQETFSALVQQSSSKELSFPRLFKRLVDATASSKHGGRTTYNEFRLILGGMLDSYRTEEDVLVITKRLAEQDLFEIVAEYTRARKKGVRMR